MGLITEDREMAPKDDQAPTAEWPKKALTPIASVLGSESSSNSSMERLLQEVTAFVVRTDSGAAEAAVQHRHQHQQPQLGTQQPQQPMLTPREPSNCTRLQDHCHVVVD